MNFVEEFGQVLAAVGGAVAAFGGAYAVFAATRSRERLPFAAQMFRFGSGVALIGMGITISVTALPITALWGLPFVAVGIYFVRYGPTVAELAQKRCPQCAETVNRDAQVCRYCRHQFGA